MKTLILLFFFSLLGMQSPTLECSDLLRTYDQAPPKSLQFVSCKQGTGQTILEAHYEVSGSNAAAIEDYLIERYGMGKLHFACCGWENKGGESGRIRNKTLEIEHPSYYISVSMYGNAEMTDVNGKAYIEKDRTKLEKFVVEVKILDV